MTGRTQRDEEWREIPGLLGYEASSEGRIRRTVAVGRYGANHVLSQNVSEPGYPRVNLQLLVHGLVARAFLGTRPKGRFINHKDGNKRNAAADNLEYVTPSDNAVHAYTLGLQPCGERHGRARLTDAQVAEIRTQYGGLAGEQSRLAEVYGVSQGLISQIVRGEIWTHLPLGKVQRSNARHLRGEVHLFATVTDTVVRRLREQYAVGGVTHDDLAKQYNISRTTVSRIIRGRIWKHVT